MENLSINEIMACTNSNKGRFIKSNLANIAKLNEAKTECILFQYL